LELSIQTQNERITKQIDEIVKDHKLGGETNFQEIWNSCLSQQKSMKNIEINTNDIKSIVTNLNNNNHLKFNDNNNHKYDRIFIIIMFCGMILFYFLNEGKNMPISSRFG